MYRDPLTREALHRESCRHSAILRHAIPPLGESLPVRAPMLYDPYGLRELSTLLEAIYCLSLLTMSPSGRLAERKSTLTVLAQNQDKSDCADVRF